MEDLNVKRTSEEANNPDKELLEEVKENVEE